MIRFGRVVIDVPARTVAHDQELQHLEPQAFDLLAYLLEHRDRVVPKGELLDEVWGDQFVSESALTTRIKEVRRAVGDDGTRQTTIKNFRGRGYRFVADLDATPADESPERSINPMSALAAAPHLLGRDRDITAIVERVETAPVVSLVGPGGVGKTTLAREIGRRLRDRCPDGLRVVRLATVREPNDLVHAFRLDTEISDAGVDEADLVAAIAGLDALVIVDNCEHVIDEAARLIAAITERGGPVHILTTSRERLGVTGESVWPVSPLDDESARALLRARIGAVQPDFQWEPADEEHIDRLLAMVDNLPLGIEMAAARLPSIGAADLVQHLTGRLDLLQAPTRENEERHRTLIALVEWSERLLEPTAQSLLLDLSVFAGPNRLDDIAAVVGADAGELAFGPIAELIEQSLLVADTATQPTRYRLLETVRAAVTSRRSPTVDERHAHHVADLVDDADRALRSADEPAAAERMDNLIAEIRVAHRWARHHDIGLAARLTTGLLHYAQDRHWPEPAQWCGDLDLQNSDVDTSAFAAVVGADAANRGDFDRAAQLADQARTSTDPRVVAVALNTLSDLGLYTGELDTARGHGAQLYELGQATEDGHFWTLGLLSHVLSYVYDGRASDARHELEHHRPPGPIGMTTMAWLAYAEAEVRTVEGREREAIESYEQAIALARSVGSRFIVSVSEVSRLAAMSRAGDVDEAIATFTAVLARYRQSHSTTHAITALRNVVVLLVRAHRDRPAMELLGSLAGDDTKSTYGIESDLLAKAEAEVRDRHSDSAVDDWMAAGVGKDPSWAIERGIAALASDRDS